MRKHCAMLIILLLILCPVNGTMAAEVSDDPMMLEWTTTKIWVTKGELFVVGNFVNQREDITITKLNAFNIRITFTRDDGTTYQFVGAPKKLPLCKIPAGGSKQLTLNFGPFDDSWRTWVTAQDYAFSYINGARW